MTLALEIRDPNAYGKFDDDQLRLIKEHNAYDLVLIENATELFREVMHDKPGNLELFLNYIVKSTGSHCIPLPSETFPYYISRQTAQQHPDDYSDHVHASARVYRKAIAVYKEKNLRKQRSCVVGVFAVDLGESGGHYATYVLNNGTLLIFDSMATNYGNSGYYGYFQQLGKDLFGDVKEIVVPCVKGLISLQETGGFPRPPEWLDQQYAQALQHVEQVGDFDKVEQLLDEKNVITQQTTESQNHFCYM